MNIEYLKALIAVSQEGSISKAAEQLHISQSALSQQIRTLERNLNVKLFNRSHKGVILTEAGETVYLYALKIIENFKELRKELEKQKNHTKEIKILSTSVFHSYALPCTLYNLNLKYPNFKLDTKVMTTKNIEQEIQKGMADIGLISGLPSNTELSYQKVYTDKYYLVASTDLDVPSSILLNELYDYPILMLSTFQKSREMLDAALINKGIVIEQLNIPYQLESTESIKISALQGFGIVFLPYMSIKKELYNKQLQIITIKDFDYSVDYYAIRKLNEKAFDSEINNLVTYIENILSDTAC